MKNPATRKFTKTGVMKVEEVQASITLALKDKNFAADVQDRRILWTVGDGAMNAYFRAND